MLSFDRASNQRVITDNENYDIQTKIKVNISFSSVATVKNLYRPIFLNWKHPNDEIRFLVHQNE